jgi:multidrug efflux pump subunit AcrB
VDSRLALHKRERQRLTGAILAREGLPALWITPREEEPQIVVPIVDVFISAPGLDADEIERLV